jgi:hypothetical protein
MNKYTEAKDTLREAGYFVDNLWNIEDVRTIIDGVSDERLEKILCDALTSEYVMEAIWDIIKIKANEEL